jgi:simple sugar transport system permease protein
MTGQTPAGSGASSGGTGPAGSGGSSGGTGPAGSGGSAAARAKERASRIRQVRAAIVLPLTALVLAVLIGSIFVYAAAWIKDGKLILDQPLKAYGALVSGSLLSFDAIVTTLVFTSPLVLGGLAVALGFKAGLFNIGVLGQLLMGVLAAVAVGVALADQPVWIGATLAFIAGTLAGAAMGFIPGYLKATTGAHEVVTTIMLNYIAGNILAAFVAGPLRVPKAPAPVTFDVGHAALPTFIGKTGHVGLILSVIAVVAVWWLLYRTTIGFEIRTAGINPDAARYAGMRPRRLIALTMAMSGGLAGMAGAGELLGVIHKTQTSYATSVGFDAIAVALLARSNPLGVIPAALLFGAMRAGAGPMQVVAKTPRELVDVLQGVILIVLVALPVIARAMGGRGAKVVPAEAQTITASYAGDTVRP